MITGDKSNKVNEPNLYNHNQQIQVNTRKQFYDNNNKQENGKQGRQELVVQDSPSFKVCVIVAMVFVIRVGCPSVCLLWIAHNVNLSMLELSYRLQTWDGDYWNNYLRFDKCSCSIIVNRKSARPFDFLTFLT